MVISKFLILYIFLMTSLLFFLSCSTVHIQTQVHLTVTDSEFKNEGLLSTLDTGTQVHLWYFDD
jgi:hypothetical protein